MHLLATSSGSLDDLAEPIDLQQSAADVAVLSFTDSDLIGLARAWHPAGRQLPTLRLVSLKDLRHPMSVDIWADKVASHARVVIARVLGGYEWWRYGCDQLSRVCRENGVALALLPGEDQEDDSRLIAASTISGTVRKVILSYFREGGQENMGLLATCLAGLCANKEAEENPAPLTVPKRGFYLPGSGICELDRLVADFWPDAEIVPILFYRSMLLASDVGPIDALFLRLRERGLAPVPIFVGSLKEKDTIAFVEEVFLSLKPVAAITATAFACGAEPGADTLFDRLGVPVFQVIIATTRHDAWQSGSRGLNPSDLAMHVVLPELDGRILAGALSFKADTERDDTLEFRGLVNRPEPNRVEQVTDRIASFLALKRTPRRERKLAVLIPDYPNAPGRTGYAVGLDVPQSVLEMLHDLAAAGYEVGTIPATARALLDILERRSAEFSVSGYETHASQIPEAAKEKLSAAWGEPSEDEDVADGAFRFRAATFGNITVALAPDRGRSSDRRADYHDPVAVPRHALVAFGLWLRKALGCHALVHVGAHGTLEWLPGKAVALSAECFPEIVTGSLPVVYPFIVSNPGEAAVAKRRIAAVTLGHIPPPLVAAGLTDDQRKLERLVDEYAQAEGLDPKRRERLAALIAETARETGLAQEAGVGHYASPDEALARIDAWLCDLKDFAIKDGQHVYGRISADDPDPLRQASAENERKALLAALDGGHIAPGPAGAPSRGRRDVMPTGRNLYASDPRSMPTPTAFELGKRAADEAIRRYVQDHGEPPRCLIVDLWGSASLRTGGEEISQGLSLMGCKPEWDWETGRITGVTVLPPAVMVWPRVDVTFKISGLFRDMFPGLIALLDTAIGAVAARNELPGLNPLSEEMRETGRKPNRIFGSRPGLYGAGVEDLMAEREWQERAELGDAYLAAASYAYGGAQGLGIEAPDEFKHRVAGAELLIHTGDDPGRDLLEGSADVAFMGGFAAAVAALGGKADIIALDTTDPDRPRARSLAEAVTRIVRARATNPRFIEGQMRHGPRGAAELAETVDRLVGYAETTHAIPENLIEAVFEAYLMDAAVREFLLCENPEAAIAIANRFLDARRRDLWRPLRNSVDMDLASLVEDAMERKEKAT